MSNILKIFSVIPYQFKIKIFFLLLLTLALTGLELLSIGSIPIFISTLIEKKNLFIKFDFLNSILENLNLIDLSFIIITIFIIKNLLILFYNYYLFSLNFKMNIFFSKNIYYNYIFLEYLLLIKFKSSDMIRNLTGEVNNFVSCINNSIQIFRDMVIGSSIIFLIIFFLDFKLLIIFLVFLIITSLFYYFIKKYLEKKSAETLKYRSQYISTITDSFRLIKEIIINNKRNFFIDKFIKKLTVVEKNNFKTFLIFSFGRVLFEILAITMLLSVVIYFYVNKVDNTFIISYMVLLTLGIMRVMPLFNSIVTALNKIQYKKYSILAILDLLKSNNELLEKDNELDKNLEKINYKNLIQINKLSFQIDDNKILNDLNFEINKGEKICIIGESGSGKTTLINILSGLLRAPVNNYLIDDTTIIDDNIYKLRKIVSIMPQESFLINDSIRNNVCFGEDNNIKDLENIYEITNLSNLIKNFPDGDNQIISENGSNISGGEKQRILIARSLYKNFDILILDEPISSLDRNNSYEIISNIFKKYQEKTIIIITHKIDKAIKFDKTFVIKNGKLQN